MHIYCLFYNPIKRSRLTALVKRVCGCGIIVPRIVQRKWVRGQAFEELHDFLPGYMFLYSEAPIDDPERLAGFDGVYRLLGTKQGGWQLRGSDRAFAELLYENDGVIGIMKVWRDDGWLKPVAGLYGGFGSDIVKVDRRQRALVRFFFDDRALAVWVGYDVVDERNTNEPSLYMGAAQA